MNLIPTVDGETKARILQLHDPADNLDHLKNSEKVDVGQLIREKSEFFKWCSTNDETCKILRIFANNCIYICPGLKSEFVHLN